MFLLLEMLRCQRIIQMPTKNTIIPIPIDASLEQDRKLATRHTQSASCSTVVPSPFSICLAYALQCDVCTPSYIMYCTRKLVLFRLKMELTTSEPLNVKNEFIRIPFHNVVVWLLQEDYLWNLLFTGFLCENNYFALRFFLSSQLTNGTYDAMGIVDIIVANPILHFSMVHSDLRWNDILVPFGDIPPNRFRFNVWFCPPLRQHKQIHEFL